MALMKGITADTYGSITGVDIAHEQGDEMGEMLIRIQENLRTMKEKLVVLADSKNKSDLESLKNMIEKTEQDVLSNKQRLVHNRNNKALQIDFAKDENVTINTSHIKFQGNQVQPAQINGGFGKPSPGKQLKDFLRLKAVINPRHQDTRKILNETYHVPLPYIRKREDADSSGKGVCNSRPKPLALPPMKKPENKDPNEPELDGLKNFFFKSSSIAAREVPPQSSCSHAKDAEYRNVFLTSVTERGTKEGTRPISTVTQSTGKSSSLAVVPLPTPTTDQKNSFRLVVYKGKLSKSTYEFEQFQKYYSSTWGPISVILHQLENLAREYTIPVAFIDVDALVDLALYFEEKLNPTTSDLLTCLQNKEDVEKLLLMPGRRYLASDGSERAAVTIQAAYRRHRERTRYLKKRRQTWAAGLIALSWVMTCKRTLIRKQLINSRSAQLERFKVRAVNFKKTWNKIQKSKRVIIHLPSAGFDQEVRKSCSFLSSYENYQVGRLFDLADDDVENIYVSPVKLSSEVQEYYTKLLSLSGAERSNENKVPFKFLIPEGIGQFPRHNMCLAAILKYSPQALNRLRNIIKGKVAYMVPGLMSQDDLYISDVLDVPVLGTEPDISRLYSMKSGRRRIFHAAGVEYPPGECDVYNTEHLYEALARLVTENLDVPCWFFKIDNEFDGRGTAYCNVTEHLHCFSAALKERERYGSKWVKPWAFEPTYQKILVEIPAILVKFAKPLNLEMYPTWIDFLNAYLSTGGVIEGTPPIESTTVVSVDVLIDPTNEVTIVSTADEVHPTSKSSCVGFTIPQLSVDPALLLESAHKVAAACIDRGICGYINVSFITFIEAATCYQKLWAFDLRLSYSESLCQTRVLQFLTNGTLDFSQSIFSVPIVDRQQLKTSRRRAKMEDLTKLTRWKVVNRFAVVSSRLYHSDMSNVRYGVLFQLCKALGIGYDKDLKMGTVFSLLDEKQRERFGMVVLSENFQEALSTFAFNLAALNRQIVSPQVTPTTNVLDIVEGIKEILELTDQNLTQPDPDMISQTVKIDQPQENIQGGDKNYENTEKEITHENMSKVQVQEQQGLLHVGHEGVPHPSPVSDLNE